MVSPICSQDSRGIFPLWKSLAQGKELPSPFGFGLNVYSQNQTFNFMESSFYVSDFDLETVIPENIDINVRPRSAAVEASSTDIEKEFLSLIL